MKYWLVKTEPEEYSYSDLERDKEVQWTGVRNYQARNFLKEMKKNDLVLVYHSGKFKGITGLAKVKKEFYQDPTSDSDKWVAVDLKPFRRFDREVSLNEIKDNEILNSNYLVKQSRLSVMPFNETEFNQILKLAEVSID